MNEIEISEEFLEENRQNLRQFTPKSRRRGPWSKRDKEARREKVYLLHFDYNFSARKIADMMKIQRNTVNSDLTYLYSKIVESKNIIDPATAIVITLERLDIQYERLRERYDKTDSHQDKNAVEHLMLNVNSRIMSINQRLAESTIKVMDDATERLNDWLKQDRSETRYMTFFDRLRVSATARDKIQKIINEDQKKGVYY